MRLTIDLAEGPGPIAGRVLGGGAELEFTTWLGLLGVLQQAVGAPLKHGAQGSEDPCAD